MRDLARGPVLPILVTFALLALPELVLRAADWPPAPPPPVLPTDPDTVWTLRPGDTEVLGARTTISSAGLRGPERGPKPAGTRRVAFLGDSSVFGVLVDDPHTFPEQLERLLPGIESLNGGVPGFSSEQGLRRLDDLLPLQPDLLVVATLWSDNNFDAFVDRELLAGRASFGARFAEGLLHTQTFRAAATLAGVRAQPIGWGLLGQDTLLGKRRVALDDYAANLDALVTRAEASGAETLFLILANEEDLDHPDRAWAWDPYRAAMRDAARRHGTDVVDVPAAWRATGLGRALLVDAMHPSRDGHRVIAEQIAATLRARGWDRGQPLMRGDAQPPADLVDPWVEPAPAGVTSPAIAGVVSGAPGNRDPLRVEALDANGNVLDAVDLPGPAPFALQAQGTITVRVRSGRPPTRDHALADTTLDLASGPAWGVRIDLATGRVTRP